MKTMRYSAVIAVTLFCLTCVAGQESFYQRYLRIVDTTGKWPTGIKSPLLVDTNNTTARLTNVLIRLDDLRTNGELAGIRLGMSTDEVVARWGMPRGLQCSTAAGPSFSYIDTRLRFKANALDYVHLPETVRFDHGLRGDSSLKEWVRVLGEPTIRTESLQFGPSLVYETRGVVRTALVLTFDSDGQMRFPPSLWRDPDLTKWGKTSLARDAHR